MKRSISIKDLISVNDGETTTEDLGSPSNYQKRRFYMIRNCNKLHFSTLYIKEKWVRFMVWRKKRNNNFFYQIYLHITLHLLLLSIFEPLFFFQYASKIEQQVFINQISSYFSNVNENFEPRNFYYNITTLLPFNYSSLVESEIKKEISIYQKENEKLTSLELEKINLQSQIGKEKRNLKEKVLEEETGLIALWFGVLFGFGAILNIFIFRINWWKLLIEHIILMIGIGLYELWFFQNILLKYEPLTPAEIDAILAPCIYKILSSKINIFGEPPFKNSNTNCLYF